MQETVYPHKELRQKIRKPYHRDIAYAVSGNGYNNPRLPFFKGTATDISDTGIGLKTDYPLEPGHILSFTDLLKAETGMVKWSMRHNGNYRSGVELIAQEEYSKFCLEEHDEQAISVREDTDDYTHVLDKATEYFMEKLETLENRCIDPTEEPDALLRAIKKSMNDLLDACEQFENRVGDSEVIRQARIMFHKKTNPILSKSYFINRIRTWPQGSQGDYKTLEGAYKKTPLSEGIGHYLDLYILNVPLAEAVRKRIRKLEEILSDELLSRSRPSVLNIACGSCRELMGLVPEISSSGARIICVDNDSDALSFAQNRLSYTGLLPQIEFFRYNAVRMFDHELNMIEFGKQDIIYSVGFFDYLPSDFLSKMINALYDLLNPGGRLIAAFKDAGRYRSQEYHWISDWDGFLQRDEKDFRGIFSDARIPGSAISEVRDETGIIIFYVITK